jgi:hypothetical protein
MRLLLVMSFLFLALPLWATTEVSTQIYDIDMGRGNEEPLIFLTNGQVVTYSIADKRIIMHFETAIIKKTWFEFTLNAKREILSYHEIPAPSLPVPSETRESLKLKIQNASETYHPSILKNLHHARALFYEARTDAKEDSQCFNRAHVWTYEWRTTKNLYSSKTWIFFTRKFIRKYKFEWWFHVAPMVHVIVDGEVKERIMDIKYARGPLSLKDWTNIFIRDQSDCPVVEKYTDQANYPESGSCFVMKSNMYYYQPVDLEKEELTGVIKSRWLGTEVRQAYLEAYETVL